MQLIVHTLIVNHGASDAKIQLSLKEKLFQNERAMVRHIIRNKSMTMNLVLKLT